MDSAILALEDGTVFEGRSFGAPAERSGEVVFNTAITGYQEIFTDPSYTGQIVILTNPADRQLRHERADNEAAGHTSKVWRCANSPASRATGVRMKRRGIFWRKSGIPVISGLDTRALVRHLRSGGVMRGVLSAVEKNAAKLVEKARSIPSMTGLDLASRVSTKERYDWTQSIEPCSPSDVASPAAPPRFNVIAYDFGIKRNILRRLVYSGCRVTVVPALTSPEDVLALKPDGVFLSNGPGDPEPLQHADRQCAAAGGQDAHLRHLPGPSDPGAGAGRQNLQAEVRTSRRQSSGDQPADQRVEITSHNHGFAVDPDSLNETTSR